MLGDLAPRRPKITTVGPQADTSAISRENILADTRVIGGYLRALVSQSLFHCSELCAFCDIPLSLLPPRQPGVKAEGEGGTSLGSSAPINGDTVGGDDSRDSKYQWRRIFLNLRKNLKPRELAVRIPF